MHPVRFNVDGSVTLLQEDDVGHHLRTGVGLERIVGQADRTQQLRPLRDVLTDFGRLFVHRIAGGHKGDHAAGANLVERLGKKVVVNGKTELVVSPVVDLVLSKGHVANGKVEEIPSVGGFKACHGNVCLGIELLGDSAGDAVQLHAVEPAAFHALRQHTEEVAHAHAGLQNIAGLEAHVLHRVVNGADNGGAGVVGVEGGGAGGGVFLRGKCGVQLCKFVCPIWLIFIERICQTSPAHIAGEDFLLFRAGLQALKFQLLQKIDCRHIRPELGLCAADAQLIVGDAEVFCVPAKIVLVLLVHGFFGGFTVGEGLPLAACLHGNGIGVHDLLKRWRLRLVKAQGTKLYIIGEVAFVTGIHRHGFLGVGVVWFFFGDSRILCGGLFRLRIPLHEPREALPALRAGDGIEKRRVAEGNIKDADALDDIGLAVFQIHRITYGIREWFSLRGGSCFGSFRNCFLRLVPSVLLHILIRNMNEVAEIEVFQLIGNKLLQRDVLAGFQMLIVQIAFQPVIHKVDIHLKGNLIVGDSSVSDTDFRRVAEIRLRAVFAPAEVGDQSLCTLRERLLRLSLQFQPVRLRLPFACKFLGYAVRVHIVAVGLVVPHGVQSAEATVKAHHMKAVCGIEGRFFLLRDTLRILHHALNEGVTV